MPTATLRTALAAPLLVFLVCLGLYAASPVATNGDAYLTVPTAESILRHGDLSLDEYTSAKVRTHYAFFPVGHHHDDFFPWAVSLFALPAVAAVDAAHAVGIGPGTTYLVEHDEHGPLSTGTGGVLVALAAAVLTRLAQRELGSRRRAVAVGLGFGLATSAWSVASRALWAHTPSLLLVSTALLLATGLAGSRRPGWRVAGLGAAVGAAYAVRPTNAVLVLAVSAWVLLSYRRLLLAYLAGAAAVAVPFVAVNVAAYGALLPPYFAAGRLQAHAELGTALAANLVSPSRGLLVYTPLALLAVAGLVVARRQRTLRGLDVALALAAVGHWAAVSAHPLWWAGSTYGPRFMTDALPLLVVLSLPAVRVLARPRSLGTAVAATAVALATVWSLALSAEGALMKSTQCWNAVPVSIDDDHARVLRWSDAQFLAGPRAIGKEGVHAAFLGDCPVVARRPLFRG